MAEYNNILEIAAVTSGTTTLVITDGYDAYRVTGTATLSSGWTVTTSGSLATGHKVTLIMDAEITHASNAVTMFGKTCPPELLDKRFEVHAYYNATDVAWDVFFLRSADESGSVDGADLVPLSVPTGAIAVDAIDLTKIAASGGGGGIMTYDGSGDPAFTTVAAGKIILGNGSDVPVAVTPSGDATISNTGVITIATGAIDEDMLSFTISETLSFDVSFTTAELLALNTTAKTLIAAPGANKYIDVVSCVGLVTFGTAAYATNTNLQVINTNGGEAILESAEALLSTVTRMVKFTEPGGAAPGTTQIIANEAVVATVETGDPTAGGTTIVRLSGTYRIVDFS